MGSNKNAYFLWSTPLSSRTIFNHVSRPTQLLRLLRWLCLAVSVNKRLGGYRWQTERRSVSVEILSTAVPITQTDHVSASAWEASFGNNRFLARTASLCQRDYILPLWFFLFSFFLSFFFLSFLSPNLSGHWTDLNQTWTHSRMIAIWKNCFETNSPGHLPHGLGAKTKKAMLFGTDFKLWPIISTTSNLMSK